MKIKVYQLLLIIVTVVAFIALGSSLGYHQRVNQEREVLRQCTYAHNERNAASEAQCALLQEQVGVEFMCNKEGNCWVEL